MNYRICIAKGDSRFEVEGDKQFVLELLAKYQNLRLGLVDVQTASVKEIDKKKAGADLLRVAGKQTSVGEFIRQTNAKKHMDLVVVFGYYLEKVSGLASFTAADINNCYYEAKLENSNTSHMIIQNIKKGYIMAAREQKAESGKGRPGYVLTKTGEEQVTKLTVEKPNEIR